MAAIFLLLIMAIHLYGYRLFFTYYSAQSTFNLKSRIDKLQYNEDELIEISIPLNMPYYNDEPLTIITGNTGAGGKEYQYVKRKIENNILHLWGIVNKEKISLNKIENTINKNNSDQHGNLPVSGSFLKLVKSFTVIIQQSFCNENSFTATAITYLMNDTPFYSQFKPAALHMPPCSL